MDEDEARRQRIERRRLAADFTAAAHLTSSDNAPKVRVSPQVNDDDAMSKMTAQELDDHRSRNRMKVRKVPGVPQGALTLVTVAPTQVAPVAPSAVAPPSTPVDLVQLKQDIEEWIALQLKINKLRRRRRFETHVKSASDIRSEARQETKTKLIAFVLYYTMAALLVGIIWAVAGH
jgi:hypothetical protein